MTMTRQVVLLSSLFSLFTSPVGIAQQPKVNYKGLEIEATGVERAMNVALIDCPPGSNTVRGNAKPGEEFAVITLAFKVTPTFKETIVKKPVLMDATGKPYNTSVAIIDPGSVPEYKCSFPFRVPAGTKVASIQIDTAIIDVSALDAKKP